MGGVIMKLRIEETLCTCVITNRKKGETQREWFKRWMCQWHWMETDYYQAKLDYNRFIDEENNENTTTK